MSHGSEFQEPNESTNCGLIHFQTMVY